MKTYVITRSSTINPQETIAYSSNKQEMATYTINDMKREMLKLGYKVESQMTDDGEVATCTKNIQTAGTLEVVLTLRQALRGEVIE